MSTFNLSALALRNRSVVLFLILLLGSAGIYAYNALGRMEDPEFTVKAMVVLAKWPGANADSVALQVTDRIEKTLQEIAEVDVLTSQSKPGEAQITVLLRDATPARRVADVWYQVRKKVGDLKGELPQGVQGPFFNDEFGDTFGNVYAFTREGFSYAELRRYVERARDELLRVPDVSKIEFLGVQDEKIFVETSNARLASLGVDPNIVSDTLRATNAVEAAGTVEGRDQRVALRVSGEFDTVAAIADIGIAVGGRNLRLGDLAQIYRGYADPPTSKMHFDGKEAIGLAIAMRDGGDVMRLGRDLQTTLARIRAELPIGIEVAAVSDQPAVVAASIHEFTRSLVEAILIVLGVSFLSLGWRSGVVVALSIPLVLAMTFLAMYALGIDLQRISLGALIIALGLLVDDAIIAVEMMALKLEQGWDRVRAATYAYSTTALPMLTGTLITAVGFMPVGLARSGAGEYTVSIFQVVGIALMLSWVVAVVFTPYLGFHVLPEMRGSESPRHGDAAKFERGFYAQFGRVLAACLRHRRLVLGATLAVFIGALALFRVVPQQFFPASSRPELMVDLWLPQAASFSATEATVSQAEQSLRQDPDVIAVTSYIGVGSPRFYLPLDVQLPNLNFGQLMVMTRGGAARERVLQRAEAYLATHLPQARGRVSRLENGPPVGYPVQLRISGPDPDALLPIIAKVQRLLEADSAVRNINTDAGERLQTTRLIIDQDKARELGITSQRIAKAMQTSLSGQAVTQYREGDQLIDVVARLTADERTDLDTLRDTKIYINGGHFVPLSQLAQAKLVSETSVVRRRNRMPSVTVRADVVGAQGPDVTARIWPSIEQVARELPIGYRIEVGGASESSATSQASIAAVVPLMVACVLVLLMLQLRSMQKTALVIATAPLGIIGVTLILAIFQVPFGFVALLGTLALAGMIMRNSIILIDQIDQDLAQGVDPWDAVIGSTLRRFRPIVLTALAAILAMIPLTHSTFWGPMAWSIMGGLSVATVLTLIVLPVLYSAVYRVGAPHASVLPPAPPMPLHGRVAEAVL